MNIRVIRMIIHEMEINRNFKEKRMGCMVKLVEKLIYLD